MAAFPRNPEIVTKRYRGPDRRENLPPEPAVEVQLKPDSAGHAVVEVKVTSPARRDGDSEVEVVRSVDVPIEPAADPRTPLAASDVDDPSGNDASDPSGEEGGTTPTPSD